MPPCKHSAQAYLEQTMLAYVIDTGRYTQVQLCIRLPCCQRFHGAVLVTTALVHVTLIQPKTISIGLYGVGTKVGQQLPGGYLATWLVDLQITIYLGQWSAAEEERSPAALGGPGAFGGPE